MSESNHVILMMADQLRFDCLSTYGNLKVSTPNLDAMADESVVFERAYCSTPLCVPTRSSIATGKWPHTCGAFVNGGGFEEEKPFAQIGIDHPTYYEHFTDRGRPVTHVGVHHVRSPKPIEERSPSTKFITTTEYVQALREQGHAFPNDSDARRPCGEFRGGKPVCKMYSLPNFVRKTEFDSNLHQDRFWAEKMCDEILAADPAQPQLWIFQMWAPHPPFFVPEPYYSMYSPNNIDLPDAVGEWYDATPGFLLHTSGARGAFMSRDEWRKTWAAYFGLVTLVDDCIGKVVAAFKEAGIWDEAAAMFTQDHGEHLGCRSLFQKMTMYEESAHVPLFIKPPKSDNIAPGRRPQPVGHIDVADTFCDYAGLEPIADTWGSSLRTLVNDPDADWREETFIEFNGDHGRAYPSRCVVTERYKYIYHFCDEAELYDLKEDPGETKSLTNDPTYAPVIADLHARLKKWMRETGDMLDIDVMQEFHPSLWRHYVAGKGWTKPMEQLS